MRSLEDLNDQGRSAMFKGSFADKFLGEKYI